MEPAITLPPYKATGERVTGIHRGCTSLLLATPRYYCVTALNSLGSLPNLGSSARPTNPDTVSPADPTTGLLPFTCFNSQILPIDYVIAVTARNYCSFYARGICGSILPDSQPRSLCHPPETKCLSPWSPTPSSLSHTSSTRGCDRIICPESGLPSCRTSTFLLPQQQNTPGLALSLNPVNCPTPPRLESRVDLSFCL